VLGSAAVTALGAAVVGFGIARNADSILADDFDQDKKAMDDIAKVASSEQATKSERRRIKRT
jgi:hypothetical protein